MSKRLTRAQLDAERSARAGCISLTYSRETGALVGVYRAADAQMDAGAGPWATVCETHGTTCGHATLAMARYHAPMVDWCEQCTGVAPQYETPRAPDYRDNIDRTGAHRDGYAPCAVCGRAVRLDSGPAYVHLYWGAVVVTPDEDARLQSTEDASADLGLYPVGPDCLKRYPALRAYVVR